MRPARADPGARAPALLSLADVSRRLRDGGRELVVLDGVSLALEPGVAAGVYGARGSGKSTLLRLAAMIEPPDSGTVRFAGRDVTRISQRERARLLRGPVALITAAGWQPCPGETVLDHVAMSIGGDGLTLREARHRARGALERVGAAAVGGEELTAGLPAPARARVMLARALVREPRLLVVDEPLPMPNLRDRERFCALLRASAREGSATLLMASEEIAALQGVDLMMSIAAGELCSSEPRGAVVPFPRRRAAVRARS